MIWDALTAFGTIAVAIVAVIPIFRDRPILRVHMFRTEDIDSTGRRKAYVSITNKGRRPAMVDRIVIEYDREFNHTEALNSERRRLTESESVNVEIGGVFYVLGNTPAKRVVVVDSTGKKWRASPGHVKDWIKAISAEEKEE